MGKLAIALDHLIFPVRDFNIVAEAWKRMGFRVMEPMKHEELGSWNRIIQFQNTYMEIFSRFEYAIAPIKEAFVPIINHREGLAFVGFNCAEIDVERQRAAKLGLNVGPTNNARRKVKLPDGVEMETASGSASARFEGHLLMTLFYAEHHNVDAIWQPYYMSHENGVKRIKTVVWMSDFSAAERSYFEGMLDAESVDDSPGEVRFVTRRDETLLILSAARAQERYGANAPAIDPKFPKRVFGMEFEVESIGKVKEILGRNNVHCTFEPDGSIIVAETETHGVVVRFHS